MIPFSSDDFPKPGATDYCAKRQALPLLLRCCSMTSWFHLVDFQCCGKGLRTDNDGKTISILRLYNAICINNIDFRSTTKHLKPRSRVGVSFWTSEVILISIEANNNLSICQKENSFTSSFILILVKVFQLLCANVFWPDNPEESLAIRRGRGMNDLQVLMWRCQMQILKQYPHGAWLRVSVMKP